MRQENHLPACPCVLSDATTGEVFAATHRLRPGYEGAIQMQQGFQSVQSVEQVEIVGDTSIDREAVLDALRECYDPEIPVNVVDLGLIYQLRIEGDKVNVLMTLTAIGCPVAPEVMAEVQGRIKETAGVESCEVDLTFEPMWTPERMTEDARWELGI